MKNYLNIPAPIIVFNKFVKVEKIVPVGGLASPPKVARRFRTGVGKT